MDQTNPCPAPTGLHFSLAGDYYFLMELIDSLVTLPILLLATFEAIAIIEELQKVRQGPMVAA